MLRIFRIKYQFTLHPYLKQNLQKLKLSPLTSMQQQVLSLSENKQNILINQNTGSGKTLCYLVPLLNNILNSKRIDSSKPWGGLILTLTKQLGVQIYKQVRLLDPQNRIKISRIGSISHFSGIVEKLNKKTQTSANLDQIVKQNVVNTVNWSNWDIVVSTPHALVNAINKQQHLLRPQMVVIDEADMLLVIDDNIATVTKNIMRKYLRKSQKAQYILASSSFPPKMMGIQSKKALNSLFPKIQIVESTTKHKLPTTLKVQFVDTQQFQNETNDDVLLKTVSNLLSSQKKARIIVFCNSSKIVEDVSKVLTQNNVKNDILIASSSTQVRTEVLSNFQRGAIDVLVATNLASRGFDLDVDVVIQYNMATNVVDYINRAGRTARFGKKGTMISFIEEQDQMLFKIIKQKLQKNEPMDQAFSRKRSLSKTNKKYQTEPNDTL